MDRVADRVRIKESSSDVRLTWHLHVTPVNYPAEVSRAGSWKGCL